MSAFIKDILLPEKIKSYYLFPKIVVGVEINKVKITATKTRINGTTSTIEAIIEEKLQSLSLVLSKKRTLRTKKLKKLCQKILIQYRLP